MSDDFDDSFLPPVRPPEAPPPLKHPPLPPSPNKRPPRAKPLTSEAMVNVVRRAMQSPRGVALYFPTEGEAIGFRQRYYKMRSEEVKKDVNSEWRTISCLIDRGEWVGKGSHCLVSTKHETPESLWAEYQKARANSRAWRLRFIPSDSQVEEYIMEEL